MESLALDMEDIFDDGGGSIEEQLSVQAPLPQLSDDEGPMRRGSDDEAEEAPGGEDDGDVLNRLKDIVAKGAAKKRVMRPQPKLNADRLKSNRGLPILAKEFENVKFKGMGHEASDLRLLMKRLEHWAHRLFPKVTFDEFIERMEKLGAKKEVQTCVKRIRLDMPVLDDDYVINQESDGEDAEVQKVPSQMEPEEDNVDAEEAFEEMIRQEKEKEQQKKAARSQNGQDDGPDLPPANTPDATEPKTPGSLTDEQRERIERNKRIALEKRLAKMGSTPTGSASTSFASPSTASPKVTSPRPTSPRVASLAGAVAIVPVARQSPDKSLPLTYDTPHKSDENKCGISAAEAEHMTPKELLSILHDDPDLDIPEPLSQTLSQPAKPTSTQEESMQDGQRELNATSSHSEGSVSEQLYLQPTEMQEAVGKESLHLQMPDTVQSCVNGESLHLQMPETVQSCASGESLHLQMPETVQSCPSGESLPSPSSGESSLDLHLSESVKSAENGKEQSLCPETDNTGPVLDLDHSLSKKADNIFSNSCHKKVRNSDTDGDTELTLKMSLSDEEQMEIDEEQMEIDERLDDSVIVPDDTKHHSQ